jgi:hypothetical protein
LRTRITCLLLAALFSACHADRQPIVSEVEIDSLIRRYTPPPAAKENEADMEFWRSRINPSLPDFLNRSRYAGGLAAEFHLFGDIDSLRRSDSILEKVLLDFNDKEASAYLALAAHAITQHRFSRADSFLQAARQLGLRPYESFSTSFDVDFELGRYTNAQLDLNAIRSPNDYGYFFRKAKMDHLKGNLDSAIAAMTQAATLADNNAYLKDIALANAGDLYLHAADLRNAADLYLQCLRLNSADFHSLLGLGWIAAVQDDNYSLAGKIFHFVQTHNRLPDPLFKLTQLAEFNLDSAGQQSAARAFEKAATDPRYGRMYNKYLVELYTGILNAPARAESLAKDELNNRSTPQTFAWYAWALFANHKPDSAMRIFDRHISGNPLEGLELYYMGKLMKGTGKGYNAREFFKAANTTRYDLSPAIQKDIDKQLEE